MSDQHDQAPREPARSTVVASWGQVRASPSRHRSGTGGEAAAQTASKATQSTPLPKRKLGRTGVEVSILNFGTCQPDSLNRLLPFAWSLGVRYVDTAHSYGSEPAIARWMKTVARDSQGVVPCYEGHAEHAARADRKARRAARGAPDRLRRPDLHPRRGRSEHRRAGQVAGEPGVQGNRRGDSQVGQGEVRRLLDPPPAPARDLAERPLEGVSSTRSCWQNNPWSAKEDAMNRALDACHKAGIGLISMKQVAGNVNLDFIARELPELKEKGLKPYQGLLHAIWTDERFSSCCVSMRNTDQVRDNADGCPQVQAAECRA